MHTIKDIPIAEIKPGNNDRKSFDQAALAELAQSIGEHGLAQPITVRHIWECSSCGRKDSDSPEWCDNCKNDTFYSWYEIVAGERRFRAISKILKWDAIPAIIRALSDEAASAVMLAENVARADLDPIDEALAYQSRIDRFGWSVKDCAKQAGVSSVRVQFRLKLLRLRPELQELVRNSDLALGYAQILSSANLDTNRQMLAISRLRDNPHPTPYWFRREVNSLREEQAQESLFDTSLLVAQAAPAAKIVYEDPPLPSTTTPPLEGKTAQDRMCNLVAFWQKAAAAWEAFGKPFKRQECQAAATALKFALVAI